MAIINMRVSTLLVILLLNNGSCTSHVTGEEAGSTAPPKHGYHRKDARDIDHDIDTFYHKPLRDYEPVNTERTEFTTSYLTTEPQESRNKYTIDYQEASRRGRSEVTIQLLPLLETAEKLISERLMVAIEYNKKIRRIRKVWGGKVKLMGNTVYVTTDIRFSVAEAIHSFGYTIEYRGRGSSKNYPVYMEVRSADDF